jgi:transposase InsO family protein
LHTIPIT